MKKIKRKNLKNLIEIMFLIIALMVIVSCKKKDEVKPIITLKGNKEITIDDGGQYKELGVIATDNIDGDISKMIGVPVFHVNGDDVEAVAHVARLAIEYRQQFGRDVLSNAQLVEAIETEFTPLLIHNNKPGKDAEVLRRFGEPAERFRL